MSKHSIFNLTFAQLYLLPLSDTDLLFIINIFRHNPDITDIVFKDTILKDNPELYYKLILLDFID